MKFTERLNASLRIEGYNAFNHANLNQRATDLTSNNFGTVTSAQPGLLYTLSLRLRF